VLSRADLPCKAKELNRSLNLTSGGCGDRRAKHLENFVAAIDLHSTELARWILSAVALEELGDIPVGLPQVFDAVFESVSPAVFEDVADAVGTKPLIPER